MNDSIKLSEEHGVNPSIHKCFFCGNDKGLVLLGQLPNDEKAPKEIVMDIEPCDQCDDIIKHPEEHDALIMIEKTVKDTNNIMNGLTGRFAVAKRSNMHQDFLERHNIKHIVFVEQLEL